MVAGLRCLVGRLSVRVRVKDRKSLTDAVPETLHSREDGQETGKGVLELCAAGHGDKGGDGERSAYASSGMEAQQLRAQTTTYAGDWVRLF